MASYEMAAAYVTVMPSLAGMQESLKKQINDAIPDFKKSLSIGVNTAIRESIQGMGSLLNPATITNKFSTAFKNVGREFESIMHASVSSVGNTVKNTLSSATKVAGTGILAGVGLVGGQMATGGLTRALGLNEANAKLKALGYDAVQMTGIMQASANAVDGTAYAMNESVTTAVQLLAAGITDNSKLEMVLKNVGKLADISGGSFGELGTIIAQTAASGVAQWGDLSQLIDRGIPVQTYLAKQLGVTTAQVKTMASAGKITFEQLADAVNSIDFNSAEFAAENVKLAFNNVRAQLSKIGASLWKPIIDSLGPILVKVRQGLSDLQKNQAFTDIINKINTSTSASMSKLSDMVNKIFDSFSKVDVVRDKLAKITEAFDKFKATILGFEGPIAGLGAALGSKFLSSIPVIGPLLGEMSASSGLLIGAFYDMYNKSELLQGSFKNLYKVIGGLFDSLNIKGNKDTMKILGDSFSHVIDAFSGAIAGFNINDLGVKFDFVEFVQKIFGGVSNFIIEVGKRRNEIVSSIKNIIDSIRAAVEKIKGNKSIDFGTFIADVFVKAIKVISNVIDVIIPLAAGMIRLGMNVFDSSIFQGFLGGLISIASFLSRHQVALFGLGATLGALFLGGKLLKPMFALMKFFGQFSGVNIDEKQLVSVGETIARGIKDFFKPLEALIGEIGGVFKNIFKTASEIVKAIAEFIATVIKSLTPILQAIGTVLVTVVEILAQVIVAIVIGLIEIGATLSGGAEYILAIGIFVLAVAGVIWLLEKMGTFESLKKIADNIIQTVQEIIQVVIQTVSDIVTLIGQIFTMLAGAITDVWGAFEPIATFIRDSVLLIFNDIIGAIIALIQVISDSINSFISTAASGAALVTQSISDLLVNLAIYGPAAALGALDAAGGISALAYALLALGASSLLSNLTMGIGNLFTGLISKVTGIDLTGIDVIVTLANALVTFNANIQAMPGQWAGISAQAYDAGFTVMSNFGLGMQASIVNIEPQITSALIGMIQRIQAIVDQNSINIRVNVPDINGYGIAGGNGTINTTNNNYDVNVNNGSVLSSLARSAR